MANGVQNRGAKFQICTTAQPNDLTANAFAALTYEDVCCIQDLPEFSVEANLLSENCISGERITGVGADEATDFEVTAFYMDDCEGQEDLRQIAMAKDGKAYAVRKIYSDGVSGVTTATTVYARVIWTGFSDGGGGIDDFVIHTFSGAVQQDPIFVSPASI